MKKVFLPLAVAAALLLGSKAQAQVPEWINFQGVCTVLSGTPTVHFVILDENDTVVYAETQQVTTNAKGAFTAQIGNGTLAEGSVAFDTLEWAGKTYTLSVDINGNEVATGIEFGSVPYALVAESVGNLSGQDLDNMVENLENLVPVIDKLLDDTETALDGVSNLEDQVREITLKNMEQQSEINGLIELTDGLDEVKDAVAELKENDNKQQVNINYLMTQYGGLNERNENIGQIALENHAAIEAMQEGLLTAQQDIMMIVQKNMEQETDIIALKAQAEVTAEGLSAAEDQIREIVLHNMEQQTEINALQEQADATAAGLSDAEDQIREIVLHNMEQQTEINTLRAEFDALSESLEMTIPVLQQMESDVQALLEGQDWAEEQIREIVLHNMEQQTEINELRLDVNTALEHANKAGEIAVANFESIIEINEKIEAQKTELDDLRVLVQLQGEAIGSLQQQVLRLQEIVNGLRN